MIFVIDEVGRFEVGRYGMGWDGMGRCRKRYLPEGELRVNEEHRGGGWRIDDVIERMDVRWYW